jgi:hypothetical protein
MKINPFGDGDTTSTFINLTEKIALEIRSLENEYILSKWTKVL